MNRFSWLEVKNALIMGLLAGILATFIFIVGNGSVFGLDVKKVIDIFTFGVFGVLISFLQSLFTSPETGKFAGVIKIK